MTVDFAARLRARETVVGYWMTSDNPVATERVARVGFDYVCLDMQHGLIGYAGCVRGLTAIDAAGAAGAVRVPSNDASWIGRVLDAGARAVIVPLVNSAAEAARAAGACRYPPVGIRSYGPMRSALRIGPNPRQADESVACIVMIETRQGLDSLEAICATPGVDAVYIGPSDLALALGGDQPSAAATLPEFEPALERVRTVAEKAGIAVGFHCPNGQAAAGALAAGFTMVTISNDLNHLEAAAASHLATARGQTPGGEADHANRGYS
jgi:4-hydroxy-2-oxoheptanedioate aldolase